MSDHLERDARVLAPVQLVWEQVDSLDAVLGRTPGLFSHRTAPDGRSARITGNLVRGPIRHSIVARAELVELVSRELVVFRLLVPALSARYTARVEMHQTGAAETALRCGGQLDLGSWTAQRLRGLIHEFLEEHSHQLLRQVKAHAESRHQAEQLLED